MKCLWCLKRFKKEEKKIKKGELKDITIAKLYCSKRCEEMMSNYLMANSLLVEYDELRNKARGKRREGK